MTAYQVVVTSNFRALERCKVPEYCKEQTFHLVNCDFVDIEQLLLLLQCFLIPPAESLNLAPVTIFSKNLNTGYATDVTIKNYMSDYTNQYPNYGIWEIPGFH